MQEDKKVAKDLNQYRHPRSGDPACWKWLMEEKKADPIVQALTASPWAPPGCHNLQTWKNHIPSATVQRPPHEKTDWIWNRGMTMRCEFCDIQTNIPASVAMNREHGSWAFRPWDATSYTVACALCHDVLAEVAAGPEAATTATKAIKSKWAAAPVIAERPRDKNHTDASQ